MKLNTVFASLFGGAAVYVAMSACSTGSTDQGIRTDNGSGGGAEGGANVPGGAAGTSGSSVAQGGSVGAGGASLAQGGAAGTSGSSVAQGGSAGADASGVVFDATSPVPDAAAQTVSGSRLKAKYVFSADGAKQFYGWYDSQRAEDCTFQNASDGKMRCLPSGASGSYYADASCAAALLMVAKGQPCSAKYTTIYKLTADTCQPQIQVRVWLMGQKTIPQTVYSLSGSTCTGMSATSLVPTYDFYAAGAEVPPSSFVEGVVKTE
jgi:hypothetical protein